MADGEEPDFLAEWPPLLPHDSPEDQASNALFVGSGGMAAISPGRAAIYSYRLHRMYPDQLDALEVKVGLGKDSKFVVWFRDEDHWLLCTMGFTDLCYRTGRPGIVEGASGHGAELTLRIPREPGEDEKMCPRWAYQLLANLLRDSNDSAPYKMYDRISLGNNSLRPGDPQCLLRGFFLVPDPALRPLDTPFGRVAFLSMLPCTQLEHDLAGRWSTYGVAPMVLALLSADSDGGEAQAKAVSEYCAPAAVMARMEEKFGGNPVQEERDRLETPCLGCTKESIVAASAFHRPCVFEQHPRAVDVVNSGAERDGSACRGNDGLDLVTTMAAGEQHYENLEDGAAGVHIRLGLSALEAMRFGLAAAVSHDRQFHLASTMQVGCVVIMMPAKEADTLAWAGKNGLAENEWCVLNLVLGTGVVNTLLSAIDAARAGEAQQAILLRRDDVKLTIELDQAAFAPAAAPPALPNANGEGDANAAGDANAEGDAPPPANANAGADAARGTPGAEGKPAAQ